MSISHLAANNGTVYLAQKDLPLTKKHDIVL